MNKNVILSVLAASLLGMTGCAAKSASSDMGQATVVQVVQPPGVVEDIWEEPMTDVVDVPPGLDPEGHYYRPAHQEVVEIRQGRWKYHRKPEDAAQ